jgi:hypothetical protein
MKKIILIFLFPFIISACTNTGPYIKNIPIDSTANQYLQLTGKWKTVGLNVTMHTVHNTKHDSSISANESNWEQQTEMEPIIFEFNKNGTFATEYRDVLDSLQYRGTGIWRMKGMDSLLLYSSQSARTYTYTFKVRNDSAFFHTVLDFDDDGKADDEMLSIVQKVK